MTPHPDSYRTTGRSPEGSHEGEPRFHGYPPPLGFIRLQGFHPKQAFLKKALGQEDLLGWEGGTSPDTKFPGFLPSIITLYLEGLVE